MRYPSKERRLEKERAVIRDPKNEFPWISDAIDPTPPEVDVSRSSDTDAARNDDIGELMVPHVPPVTVYPSARRSSVRSFPSAPRLRRASGSDARKVQASAGFRISSPSTPICNHFCDSRIGVQPAAPSCRRRRTASRGPDLGCRAEPTDTPQPPA